jgi:hypothetical protein
LDTFSTSEKFQVRRFSWEDYTVWKFQSNPGRGLLFICRNLWRYFDSGHKSLCSIIENFSSRTYMGLSEDGAIFGVRTSGLVLHIFRNIAFTLWLIWVEL